jgi:hypothetical protein
MAGATIDHLISVTVFLAAILLFISLFNQTIQTAILYQRHRYLATKCTDLLDNVLLNPGYPMEWGKTNVTPTSFGVQDPEFTQYRLSPFSLMRLRSSTGTPVYYPKTNRTYSNITMGFGDFLLMPYTDVVNYSTASMLLGANNTYGFKLTVEPMVAVTVSEVQAEDPLRVQAKVSGNGFPLAYATLSYCFLQVSLSGGGAYPSYTTKYGNATTDDQGSVLLSFPEVDDDEICYAIVVYAQLSGLTGVGYHQRVSKIGRAHV